MREMDERELADLALALRRRFEHQPPVGYLDGKTALRDAVEAELGCSDLEAEEIVDTLELQRHLVYEGDPASPCEESATWRIAERDVIARERGTPGTWA
jgi:hypothetical protein